MQEFERYVIKDDKGRYQHVNDGMTDIITSARMYHSYDDACYVANKLNKDKEDKHIALSVTVRYMISPH